MVDTKDFICLKKSTGFTMICSRSKNLFFYEEINVIRFYLFKKQLVLPLIVVGRKTCSFIKRLM